VNVCHLVVHTYLLPFKVPVMNQLEASALVLKCALNLCGLAMNYLEMAKKASPIAAEDAAYNAQINAIQTVSIALTVLIVCKFGFRFAQMAVRKAADATHAVSTKFKKHVSVGKRWKTERGGSRAEAQGLARLDALQTASIELTDVSTQAEPVEAKEKAKAEAYVRVAAIDQELRRLRDAVQAMEALSRERDALQHAHGLRLDDSSVVNPLWAHRQSVGV